MKRKLTREEEDVILRKGTEEPFTGKYDMHFETAYFAAGCYWGVEHHLKKAGGVISTTVGFMGGKKENPVYKDVCGGGTGHAETVEVVFDPGKTPFEDLTKLFFEIHDFTQADGQGPDIGMQYRSGVFYTTAAQKKTAERIVAALGDMGYDVKTEITKAGRFWPAEEAHQDYYDKKAELPYCHVRKRIFRTGPLVMVLTGDGKGKSTSAFGQVLRASGHGLKSLVVQFVKSPQRYGEVKALEKIPGVEIHTMGKGFVGAPGKQGIDMKEHVKAAAGALAFAKRKAGSGGFDLIVLDEINFALSKELLSEPEIMEFLDGLQGPIAVILTGRGAPDYLLDRADLVTEMVEIKHHYSKGIKAKKGIEF